MTAKPIETMPLEQILAVLGGVEVPGQLSDFAAAIAQRKASVLRCRREVEPDDLPFGTAEVDWYRLGRRPLDPAARPSRQLAYGAADYYIQDASSLLALAAADADQRSLAGRLICDLCAAPGGKASALVEAIGETGFVLANEVIQGRLGPLQLNLARTGSDRYAISSLDPESLADRLAGLFDLVVVDAPCSGQALLARGKQKTSSMSPRQIEHSARRQQRILDAAVRLTRSGGRLIYSTCTFAEAENEAQARRLLDAGAVQVDPVDRLAEYETSPGCYRLWPHRHDCAGSFASSMIVTGGGDRPAAGPRRGRKREQRPPTELSQWYNLPPESTRLQSRDAVILGWPDDAPDWVEEVAASGPELAHRAGRTWRPSHSAALRRSPQTVCLASAEINDEAAKSFLRGEPIGCDRSGWQVVRWAGRPLGWIKGDGAVGKNHLPAAARSPGEWLS